MSNNEEFKLTEHEIEQIAERAAEIALTKVYTSIGKSVVSKFFIIVGVVTVAIMTYLNSKGIWK